MCAKQAWTGRMTLYELKSRFVPQWPQAIRQRCSDQPVPSVAWSAVTLAAKRTQGVRSRVMEPRKEIHRESKRSYIEASAASKSRYREGCRSQRGQRARRTHREVPRNLGGLSFPSSMRAGHPRNKPRLAIGLAIDESEHTSRRWYRCAKETKRERDE